MSLIIPMLLFSLVMSISPGPVNMVILSSGINHGFRSTLPYVSGATIGFTLLLITNAFIFDQLISTYPQFLKMLSVLGSLYIIYIGYKIASADMNLSVKEGKAPKFFEGFALQWINAKAWIACVSGVTLFSSAESIGPLVLFCSVYFIVCYLCLALWAVLGDKISILLNSETRLKLFNISTGGLLIVTAIYLGWTQLFTAYI